MHLLCLPAVTAYIWSLTVEEPCLVIIYLVDLQHLCLLQKSRYKRLYYFALVEVED